MRYDNGILFLDEAETKLLSIVAMKDIEREYPALEFIRSMAEMKDEAEKYIFETQSRPAKDKSDPLRVEIIRLLIDTFDMLAKKGHEAAAISGSTIRLQ
jgi:hypothetical protein